MRPLDPRLGPHLRPARAALTRALGAQLATGLLTVAQAFAVGTLVVTLVEDPAGSGWHAAALAVAVVVGLRALTAYAGDTAAATAATQVSGALRRRLLDAATRLDAQTLSRHRTGELSLLATRGAAAVEPYLTRYLPALVLAAVLPVTTLAAIFWLDWLSGLIVLLTLPLVPVFAILIGKATRARADRQWRQLGALAGHFLDVVRGLPTLVAHRRARAQSASIRVVTDRYRRATLDTLRLAFASSVALELIATLSVALVAVCVGLRLAAGSLDYRTAMIVLLLAPEAYWPLRRVGAEYHAAAEGTASFEAADRLIEGTPAAGTGVDRRGGRPLPTGELTVDALTVGYGGEPVLRGWSGSFPATGLTAVTGPSGCGKSTLLATLVGELTPTAGTVRLGGLDLAGVDPDAWRATFAFAPQRPWLTAGTIAENVRVGRPDADDAALWRALDEVGLALTVAALPLGLDTPLGEDGAGLSAGERARVALARIVVAERPWVFLDEPTAHLDETTEEVFLTTLRHLARRSAVVVVAHRPAVVEAADRVVELPPLLPAPVLGATVTTSAGETAAPGVAEQPAERRPRFGRRTGVVLGALSVASGVALTATAAWLITRASTHPPVLTLMVAIVAVRTFGLARPVLRYAERLVSHDAALRLLAEHRARVYDALVPLVPGRLGPRRGDLLASVVDDVDAVVDEELRVRQPLWTAALVGAGAAVLAALVTPAAGVVVAAVVLGGAAGGLLARGRARSAEPAWVHARARLSERVEQTLHGARHLALWQATGPALDALDHDGDRLAHAARRSAHGLAGGRALVILTGGLGVVAMAALVPVGATGPAMLALLVLLPLALTDALLPVADAGALSVRTHAAGERLARLATLAPAVSDPSAPAPAPAHHELDVAHVSAGWGEDDEALSDVSLHLPHGRRIGVTGPSGSGKSTLAALLLRFIDSEEGRVSLGGTDLRALALDDVRRLVGLVDDDPYVFGSTVAENVRLARPDADDAAVERALRAAHLGPWLDGLPAGLATHVGEGHALVSGGERARIGIARALLADAPVLVLDEPTAHLDSATATAVAGEVLDAGGTRSVVWITHGTIGLDRMDVVLPLGAAPVPASM